MSPKKHRRKPPRLYTLELFKTLPRVRRKNLPKMGHNSGCMVCGIDYGAGKDGCCRSCSIEVYLTMGDMSKVMEYLKEHKPSRFNELISEYRRTAPKDRGFNNEPSGYEP